MSFQEKPVLLLPKMACLIFLELMAIIVTFVAVITLLELGGHLRMAAGFNM